MSDKGQCPKFNIKNILREETSVFEYTSMFISLSGCNDLICYLEMFFTFQQACNIWIFKMYQHAHTRKYKILNGKYIWNHISVFIDSKSGFFSLSVAIICNLGPVIRNEI